MDIDILYVIHETLYNGIKLEGRFETEGALWYHIEGTLNFENAFSICLIF